jgi:peptidoglycan/LPS O-acetylase OafA/YrhL
MEIEEARSKNKFTFINSLKSYIDISGAPGKFPALDGFRAIAIFLVLLRHAIHFWENELEGTGWNIWYNGWIGVDLFFVLSGFLISYHLLSKWPEQNTGVFIKSYFKKRALRILPLYIAIIALVYFSLIPYYSPPQEISISSLSVHFYFIQDYLYSIVIVLPLWSLAVEEKFYIIAPLLILLTIRFPRSVIISIVGIIILQQYLKLQGSNAIHYGDFFWNYRSPFHLSVSGILCGFILAFVYLKYPASEGFKVKLRYISIGATILVMYLLFSQRWVEVSEWNMVSHVSLICTIAFSLMLYNALINPLSSLEILKGRFLRFWAKLAYPLYICHITIIPLALVWLAEINDSKDIYAFTLFFVIYLCVSFVFSVILHLLIEKPFLIIKSRIK